MRARREEDIDIQEWNERIGFLRAILAVPIENEQKGRVQPDTFSEDERNAIIKLGIKMEKKKAEEQYWLRIGALMAGGSTEEQAREQIYRDLVEKGNLKGARLIREFQDKVHPLKNGEQAPPSVPPQPSTPS